MNVKSDFKCMLTALACVAVCCSALQWGRYAEEWTKYGIKRESLDVSSELAQSRLALLPALELQYADDPLIQQSLATTKSILEYVAHPEAFTERPTPDLQFTERIDAKFINHSIRQNSYQGISVPE